MIIVARIMLGTLPMLFILGALVAVGDSYAGRERVEAGGKDSRHCRHHEMREV